jgi:hypothetical protein
MARWPRLPSAQRYRTRTAAGWRVVQRAVPASSTMIEAGGTAGTDPAAGAGAASNMHAAAAAPPACECIGYCCSSCLHVRDA